jgi:NADP-dependent 3-hydroxy acid dehydrogenase YdfG
VNVLKSNEADWRWVLDVNLFGVLHGVQVFTPAVATQARPCLLSVTASTQGTAELIWERFTSFAHAVSMHTLI